MTVKGAPPKVALTSKNSGMRMMGSFLDGKNILVTGGTGSFGQAFIRKVVTQCSPAKVIVFSRDEWKQWEMQKMESLRHHSNIRYFLGDIRDKNRLHRAFQEVDIVIHAAALKQVPAAEYNPSEFVRTNVEGAMNIIDVAIDTGVRQVIALSTDKAVNPINLYGASKLCADKLFVAGNAYVGKRGYPKFCVVRYGNVLASRGSAISHWRELVAQGAKEIPITDERMTRFWMTLNQAVDFVIACAQKMQGGEIFIPKISSMRLIDLAQAVVPGVARKIVGVREGEKLHELLISPDDAHRTYEFEDSYVTTPDLFREDAITLAEKACRQRGKKVANDFAYASDKNSQWLTVEQLRELLKEM